MSNVVALLPTAMTRLEVPEMRPDDRDRLLKELTAITTAITRTEIRAEERIRSLDQRVATLEMDRNATLQSRTAEASRWKWWVLSIAAALISSGIGGLIGALLSG